MLDQLGELLHEMTGLVKESAVSIIYPDFSKAFNTVSYNIFKEKLLMYGLDELEMELMAMSKGNDHRHKV